MSQLIDAKSVAGLTQWQQLADLSANHGIEKIRLRPYEQLMKYGIADDGTVTVLIRRYRFETSVDSLKFTASGRLVRSWSLNQYGAMVENDPQMFWDSSFEPFTVKEWEVESRLDRLEKALWERMCYRPGTRKTPMDIRGVS